MLNSHISKHNNNHAYSHNNKKIILNILFPLPPSKTYNNLQIDDESVSYITTPGNSDIIASIIDSQIPRHIQRTDVNILDATACVGGDSISFGKMFGTVVSTEIDSKRYSMLVNNLKEFELANVIPINEDCMKAYRRLNFLDIIYFDPPWGGRSYRYEKDLHLTLGDVPIEDVINTIFNSDPSEKMIRSDIKMVVLKLPKNYDICYLYNSTKRVDTTMFMYDLPKMIVVVIKKNNYV